MQQPTTKRRNHEMHVHFCLHEALDKPLRIKRAAGPGDRGDDVHLAGLYRCASVSGIVSPLMKSNKSHRRGTEGGGAPDSSAPPRPLRLCGEYLFSVSPIAHAHAERQWKLFDAREPGVAHHLHHLFAADEGVDAFGEI